jgi:ABC-type multidrug transport system fused ATPase/permease subunit
VLLKTMLPAGSSPIAHVPQDVFLTDGTVRENIAIGAAADLIDDERVRRAADLVRLVLTIES